MLQCIFKETSRHFSAMFVTKWSLGFNLTRPRHRVFYSNNWNMKHEEHIVVCRNLERPHLFWQAQKSVLSLSWSCHLKLSMHSVSSCEEMTRPDKPKCLLHKLTEAINSSTRYTHASAITCWGFRHLGWCAGGEVFIGNVSLWANKEKKALYLYYTILG